MIMALVPATEAGVINYGPPTVLSRRPFPPSLPAARSEDDNAYRHHLGAGRFR